MTRSVWKGPFIDAILIKKLLKSTTKRRRQLRIKTWSRRSTIIIDCIGRTFGVHNGIKFFPLTITEKMVNFKFGEFVPTRKKFFFKKKKAIQKKIVQKKTVVKAVKKK